MSVTAVKKQFLSALIILPMLVFALPAIADVWVEPWEAEEMNKRYLPPQPRNDGQDHIIYCMLATAAIETMFFLLCGYKERKTLMYVFFINLLSNMIINAFLFPIIQWDVSRNFTTVIAALEAGVVLYEFILLGFHTGWKLKIFFLLIISNALSFGIGEFCYQFILP